jgi:hypothetical protein
MDSELFWALQIAGLVLLIASSCAVVWNRRIVVGDRPAPWQAFWRRRWQVGLVLAVASLFSYYVDYGVVAGEARSTLSGLPFVVRWRVEAPYRAADQLNFLFWLLLPQFGLWATRRLPRG